MNNNDDERILNKLSNGILMVEKSALSDTDAKESKIVDQIKKLIEREVE